MKDYTNLIKKEIEEVIIILDKILSCNNMKKELELYRNIFQHINYEDIFYIKKYIVKNNIKLKDIPINSIAILNKINTSNDVTSFIKKLLNFYSVNTIYDLTKIYNLSHSCGGWINNAQNNLTNKNDLFTLVASKEDIKIILIENEIDKYTAIEIMEFVRKGRITKEKEKWDNFKNILLENKIDVLLINCLEKIIYLQPQIKGVAEALIVYYKEYIKSLKI